jgi:rhodanese-related sulfurtransferase
MGEGEDEGREELPEQVEAEEARALVAGGKVLVIDVRSAEDFAEERINGSVHSEPDEVESKIEEDHSGKEGVLIVCDDGDRSAKIAEELRGEDRQVTSLEGGFSAWTGEHLPTAPNPDQEYKGPDVKLPGAVAQSKPPEDEDEDENENDDEEDAEQEDEADEARSSDDD